MTKIITLKDDFSEGESQRKFEALRKNILKQIDSVVIETQYGYDDLLQNIGELVLEEIWGEKIFQIIDQDNRDKVKKEGKRYVIHEW